MTEAAETRSFPASKSDAATSPARGGITLTVYLMRVSEKRFLSGDAALDWRKQHTPANGPKQHVQRGRSPVPPAENAGAPGS